VLDGRRFRPPWQAPFLALAGFVRPAFGTAAMLAARAVLNTSVSLPMQTRIDTLTTNGKKSAADSQEPTPERQRSGRNAG